MLKISLSDKSSSFRIAAAIVRAKTAGIRALWFGLLFMDTFSNRIHRPVFMVTGLEQHPISCGTMIQCEVDPELSQGSWEESI